MTSDLRLVGGGIKSFFPRMQDRSGTGGTVEARYCYAVWLRHLLMIADAGVDPVREMVIELGPGDSMGTGFAALLSTAKHYVALDVVPHAAAVAQQTLFESTVEMFRRRTSIPDATVFPNLFPRLRGYEFPGDLLDKTVTQSALAEDHLEEIRQAIQHLDSRDPSSIIRYVCPWSRQSVQPGTADLVFSQAALQEIDNVGREAELRHTFAAMAEWLRPGGIISHQVDLGMYGAEPWDRHWTYRDATWALIRGHRENYINREPLSTYENLCREFGFDVALLDIVPATSVVPVRDLAPRFRSLTERDRTARAVHIVAVKRG